jgi:hypothetical protein
VLEDSREMRSLACLWIRPNRGVRIGEVDVGPMVVFLMMAAGWEEIRARGALWGRAERCLLCVCLRRTGTCLSCVQETHHKDLFVVCS